MRGMLHAIYWRLHTAFLKNERSKAIMFLGMIEDEMKKKSLEKEIGETHMERFRLIQQSIKANSFARLYGCGQEIAPMYGYQYFTEPEKSEKEFCREIITKKAALLDVIGFGPKANMIDEFVVDPYGRIDFVAKSGRVCKIVEVKMGEAPTSLVSQIDKYRLAMELDMCLGLYDSVEAYVLAQSYPEYVLTELSRLSVIVLKHDATPESIKRLV